MSNLESVILSFDEYIELTDTIYDLQMQVVELKQKIEMRLEIDKLIQNQDRHGINTI